MTTVFTISSNNYLAQAIVLGNSVKVHNPLYEFIIFLVDKKDSRIDYDCIPHTIKPIHEIEPKIEELAFKYNIVELNTCVKPAVFQYLCHDTKDDHKVVYLDPDIKLFNSLMQLETLLDRNNIVLTPHILTQIPIDGKQPTENLFLNYGIYNLGFIGLKKSEECNRFLEWWKNHTYQIGYNEVHKGVFVDQLPINLAPIFFDVHVWKNFGANMAPWNLHERFLSKQSNGHIVNNTDSLLFYHFSSFKVNELSKAFSHYKRFSVEDRQDLHDIHEKYNKELLSSNYFFYKSIPCKYIAMRKKRLIREKPILLFCLGVTKKMRTVLGNAINFFQTKIGIVNYR